LEKIMSIGKTISIALALTAAIAFAGMAVAQSRSHGMQGGGHMSGNMHDEMRASMHGAQGGMHGGGHMSGNMHDEMRARMHGAKGGMHGGGGHGGHAEGQSAGDQSVASIAFAAVNEKMHRDMTITFSGDADLDFARGMIPHHQGAVDMAKIVAAFGKDPEIRKLAEEIVRTQEAEIAFMRGWLQKRGQ
jgi:uncharacterized protein (DUF305 family)